MRPRKAPSLYLLDTNVVSDLRRPRPSPEVVGWIERQPPRSLAVSFSTVFEIQYGAELARGQSPEKAVGLERWLEGFVLSGRFRILRPCPVTARIRAKMHATPSLRGFLETRPGASKPPNGEKLAIAAQAIAVGAVVVTMNGRDFGRIHELFPLPGVLDPWSGSWTVAAGGAESATPDMDAGAVRVPPRPVVYPRRPHATRWDHGSATATAWSAVGTGSPAAGNRALRDGKTALPKSRPTSETVP